MANVCSQMCQNILEIQATIHVTAGAGYMSDICDVMRIYDMHFSRLDRGLCAAIYTQHLFSNLYSPFPPSPSGTVFLPPSQQL